MTDLEKPKTDRQRASLHVWLEQCANVLNDNAIEKTSVIEKLQTRGIDTLWTKESLKQDVYKPIFEKVTGGKMSTEDASTTDHNVVYMGLTKWVAQEFGVTLPPWPTEMERAKSEEH